jgi:hypothetical protein
MRVFKLTLLLWTIALLAYSPLQAQRRKALDPATNIFYLKTGDGHEDYTVSGTTTFKCAASGNIPSYRDAGVCFSPANAGDLIQITIDDIDLDGTTNYLLLYHGYAKTAYPMPAGWTSKLGIVNKGQIILSQSADGKLTLGLHSANANNQKGWTITVRSVTPADMTFASCNSSVTNTQTNRGGRNQLILDVNIETSGSNLPLSVSQFDFNSSIPANTLQSVKLYSNNVLIADAANFTSNFSIPASVTLQSGNNHFSLRADILPDAVVNTSLPINLASVTLGGETKMSHSSPTTYASVSGDILIQSTPLSYSIGDAANFYDDGGKSGKITANFNGTITFLPSTPGKKIKIDFSKLEIFNTSSVGYNDVLKFYNGTVVDESKLNTTLLKTAETVKSTSDDGALTVSLVSTTGVPANGWEAVVSEFMPGNMSFAAVETTNNNYFYMSAGDNNQAVIIFNVKTDNALNPLNLQGVKVDATGTSQLAYIKNVRLYSLGKVAVFSTTSLVGETAPTTNEFSVTGNQKLQEGNNYFALAYDVADNCLNTSTLSAILKSVTVSGAEQTLANQTAATLTISNQFKALVGNYAKTIYDEWQYTDQKSPYNSTLYNYENENCVVTFTPAVANSVAELEFSAFDVYYSNSSIGTKAVFEVYSGNTTDAANLIWKLDDNSKSKTGPGRKLRSVATNGAMTIKFNANTTTSSYAGTGWKAKVRPFVDRNMAVDSIVAFQTNSANIAPSATNQEIIGFEVTTTGTLSPLNLESVKLNLKNSLASINKVSVLYSGIDKNFANATVVGNSLNPTTAELNVATSQVIPEGKVYFWISYDIKDDVESNQAIDAELISLTLSGETTNATKDNPEGQRLTKNEIVLNSGNNGQVTLNKSRLFYDNGGASAAYSLSFDGQITFLPAKQGDVVKLKFNTFNTYSTHYMYVYAGTEVNTDKLLAKVSGSTLPAQLISTADNGAMTIRFISTSSGSNNAGWEAEVSSYTPSARTVESVTTSQVGEATIMRGSGNEPVQKVVVKVSGDKGSIALSNLTFNSGATTNLADITKATLYYSAKSSGFIANNSLGTSNSSTLSFDLSGINLPDAGEYYFWLAYDINNTATAGNTVAATLSSITADNNVITTITTATPVNRIIKAGFSGEYVVGKSSTANYSTINAALIAMKDGIEGPVKMKLEAGTYAENVVIRNIRGASATNTITFTSLSGNNDDVIISGAGYSEPAYGAVKYGMFCVDSTSNVVVENISFKPTDQNYPYNVHIRNISRYFTLRNCQLTANLITSGYTGMNQFYMEATNVEGKNSDYVTVEGNTVTGGYIGLYMGGTGYVALTKQQGAIIRNNRLVNQASKGIYLMDERNALIEKNNISSATTQKTDYQAIDIYRCKDELIICNNKINISQPYYSKGINLRSEVAGTTTQPALIYNNAISIINSPNTSTYGIAITDNCSNIQLYYNTVYISGTAGYAIGITGTAETMKNMISRNNLLQNKTASPIYFFNRESQVKAHTFSHNAYLLTGSSFSNNWGATLAAWITTSAETNSFAETAKFVSETDLHLTEAGNLNAAKVLNFIAQDADGKTRSNTTPTIGAYEFENVVAITPDIAAGYPKISNIKYNSADYTVKYNQSGKLYCLILPATQAAPAESELLQQTYRNINQDEELTVSFANLNEETAYKVYCVVVSALGKTSVISESASFSTLKQIFPLVVSLPKEWGRIDGGTQTAISATVTGGVYPYHFTWRNDMNQTISTDSVLSVSPSKTTHYTLTVADSNAKNVVATTVLLVNGSHIVADFEDLYLAPETYWQGPDGNTDTNMESKFYSGSYAFSNTYYPDWNYWGGYAYSNVTSTSFDPAKFETQQFRSVVGHGTGNTANYAVVYTMGARTDINFTHTATADVIPGVYLTNAAYTYYSIMNGDSFMGAAFAEGDWFKLTFKGTKTDGTTSTKEIYLADYRSANASERYVVTDWKWYDLSSLGLITKLSVTVDGSRKNSGGLTIPSYFCMDKLGAEQEISTDQTDLLQSTVQVYPNPFTDYIIVKSDKAQTLKLFNVSGQCLISTQLNEGDNRVDVQSLPKGTYVLQSGNERVKLVK